MVDGMHLGDEVEIVTDRFAELGAPLGAIGVIVSDWADGSNDVQVSDPHSGKKARDFGQRTAKSFRTRTRPLKRSPASTD